MIRTLRTAGVAAALFAACAAAPSAGAQSGPAAPSGIYLVNAAEDSVVLLGGSVLTYKDGTVGVQVAVVYDTPQTFDEGEASVINYVYQYDCVRGLSREKGSVLMTEAFEPVASNFEPAAWAASPPKSALGAVEAYACRHETARLQPLPERDVRAAAAAHWARRRVGG